MFTIQQIKDAHLKVKSGADFPAYIQALKVLGVLSYEHYVADGHIQYDGANDYAVEGDGKWAKLEIAEAGNIVKLKQALIIHQQGQTDYLTFCKQSAEAGVEKWIVDIATMTCAYYDLAGNEMVVEIIPG